MMVDFKVFRLGKGAGADYFPAGFNQHNWYGIYYSNAPEQDPFIVLLNAEFDLVTQQASDNQQGYLVLFSHNFLPQRLNDKLQQLPLFVQQGFGPFSLNEQQVPELNLLFDKICRELPSDYAFKKELLATLITQLLHFVIKNFTSSMVNGQ